MSQFAAHALPLRQLFANPFLAEAPPYQRAFAWTKAEAGQLLEDVLLALEDADGVDAADYFLGTMLFIDRDPPPLPAAGWPLAGGPRTFEVVDGLQRLTTLTILFCVLRDLDADDGAPANERLAAAIEAGKGAGSAFWLALRGPDQAFLLAHARARGATHAVPEQDPLPPAHKRILEVREHFIAALADLEVGERRRLADFLLDACYVVLISTTGIDRAYRMFTVLNDTGKELARNDILKAMLLGSVPPASLPRATAVWDGMETGLGADFESLFSHVRAMRGRPGANVVAGVRAIAVESGGADAFIEKVMRPAAAVFDDIGKARHAGSPRSAEIVRTLTYLNRLPSADWVPPAMLWWLGRGADAGELAWFLASLDRLAHGLAILGQGNSKRATRMGLVAAAIRNREDLRAPTGPLALTRSEIRSIHYNLRDLHVRSAQMARLVLLRLNDQMTGRPQPLAVEDLTVEHVLPRRPGANSQWRGWFPDPAEREVYTECLGNLVLVTKPQNDKAGNLDFARKKDVLFKTAGAPLPAVNDFIGRQREWKAAQIEEREAELMRHLDALWSLGEPAKGADVAPRGRRRRLVASG